MVGKAGYPYSVYSRKYWKRKLERQNCFFSVLLLSVRLVKLRRIKMHRFIRCLRKARYPTSEGRGREVEAETAAGERRREEKVPGMLVVWFVEAEKDGQK